MRANCLIKQGPNSRESTSKLRSENFENSDCCKFTEFYRTSLWAQFITPSFPPGTNPNRAASCEMMTGCEAKD